MKKPWLQSYGNFSAATHAYSLIALSNYHIARRVTVIAVDLYRGTEELVSIRNSGT